MGAGIYVEGSPIIRRCEFTRNEGGAGGGILAYGPGTTLIEDCVISDNSAVGLGGGIAADYYAQTIVRRCQISGNSAGDGGGICFTFTGGSIEDCEIWNNDAAFGGGLDLLSSEGAKVTRADIHSNEAAIVGGGVYANDADAMLNGCAIADNYSSGDGGGAWLMDANLVFERCVFRDNSAGGTGGLHVTRSTARIWNGELHGNGLAIFVDGIPELPVDARFNWWGDASGPYHPLLNPGGKGDAISDHVDFAPWNGVSSASDEGSAQAFRLRVPGVFRDCLPIVLTLSARARVNLEVFDTQGRCLGVIWNGEAGPGELPLRWDCRAGQPAAASVNFLRLSVEGSEISRRVVRVR